MKKPVSVRFTRIFLVLFRVLEQSLIESKAGTKRKRGDIWFVDPLNPHERKRLEECPVGLKNVGNTCWFSAVIQVIKSIQVEQWLFMVETLLSIIPPSIWPEMGFGWSVKTFRSCLLSAFLKHFFRFPDF